MLYRVKFKCPKCGENQIDQKMSNYDEYVEVQAIIIDDTEEPDIRLVGGRPVYQTDEGYDDGFVCATCGYELPVNSERELFDLFKKDGMLVEEDVEKTSVPQQITIDTVGPVWYDFGFVSTIGEHTFAHRMLIEAVSELDAWEHAFNIMQHFHSDNEEDVEDTIEGGQRRFSFFGGKIEVSETSFRKTTPNKYTDDIISAKISVTNKRSEMQSNRPQQITIDTVELVVLLECAQACLRLHKAHNSSIHESEPEKYLDPSTLQHLVDKHMSRCTEQYERKIEKKM